ncbi:hypothetical protein B0A52_00099 [Exophiala mesophila]|uniref:Alpha/beta hydrolase fold-3 domain-containing protein n=1 Tax=Exophiala mesophila TaxID=212818 RepID=A0A438NJ42_EXOME|nr:hypothetical protein B0A52_00099 [Exophiala mesophila]
MSVPPTPAQVLGPPIHQISFFEKLDLLPGLLSTVLSIAYAAATAPFRGSSGASTFNRHVSSAAAVKRFSTLQLQYIGLSFGKVYEKWAGQNNLSPEFITLPSGARAFWLGDYKSAKYITVYFHGGGFSLAGEDTHLNFWNGVHESLKANGVPMATLFLEYTLVPHATYPTQVIQSVEAVNYVLKDLKRPASDILLAGDSAGGNLALAILSHISHPAPDVPPVTIPEGQKLKAAVLIAPWVSFELSWPRTKTNEFKDIVSCYAGDKWSKDYLGGKQSTPYTEAFIPPADWWKDVKVEQLLAVAGSDELLVDPIEAWFAKYKSVNPNTSTLVVAQGEIHIEPIIGPRFGRTKSEQGEAIKSWLKAKL